MNFPWSNIQGFSGVTGVGALCLFALVLIVSAFADNLPATLNSFSKTPLWSIIAAIPLIAFAYVLGLLSIACTEQMVKLIWAQDLSAVSNSFVKVKNSETLAISRFQQLWQEHEILAGSSLGFFILAISIFIHGIANKGWRGSLMTVSILTLFIAIGAFVLCGAKLHQAAQLF